jgi:serine/threonine-protein kinase RIM15
VRWKEGMRARERDLGIVSQNERCLSRAVGLMNYVASMSRPASRQPSMSRSGNATNNSPTKRMAMLPNSPNRVRRRPSAIPRGLGIRDREHIARNLSLSLDQSSQIGHSVPSSRSTSRSRSPMPPRGSFGPTGDEADDDRRFLAALQDLIVIATDILDTTVTSMASKTTYCTETIQKLQKVGQNWDDDWPGRSWYVDVLMAVVNLGKLLDWWEAEKGFWNFDEEDENEPLLFVMRPGKEESRFDQEFKAAVPDQSSPATQALSIPQGDGPLSAVSLELPSPNTSGGGGTAKPPNVSTMGSPGGHVDDLRFMAEHAKSVNIVMELGLHGEEVDYVNDAILEVTG